jgi:hypothetical protein
VKRLSVEEVLYSYVIIDRANCYSRMAEKTQFLQVKMIGIGRRRFVVERRYEGEVSSEEANARNNTETKLFCLIFVFCLKRSWVENLLFAQRANRI